ncbi:MAG TPA: AAA family ATPase [Solirubrobacterales bacterium]|jgi:DNA-binding CsgD family transcriptional regulator
MAVDRDGALIGAPSLFERESELALIDELVGGVGREPGRALVIEGPAGIGKSALLSAMLGEAREAEVRTLAARASEFERDFAFGVVSQLFEPVVSVADEAARRALFDGPAALAEPILSAPTAAPSLDASDARYAALHALFWLTVHLAEDGPLLLAVDDVQWADGPSLRFLSFLERRLEGVDALLVLTVRSGEEAADPDALAALVESGRAHRARPAPLSADATAALVAEELPDPPAPGLTELLQDVTRGNPYFLHELLRTLRADCRRPTVARAERVIGSAAGGVLRMVMRRIERLDPAAITLVEALAVLGDDPPAPIAAAVAGLGDEEAEAVRRRLVEAELLAPGDRPRLAHPLVRSTVRASLDPTRRRALQTAAARELAAAGRVEEAADHLLDVPPANEAWVAETLTDAGSAAVGRGAPEVALTLWRRALAEPPAPEQRGRLLLASGAVESELGRPEAVGRLREALETAASPPARAAATRELAEALLRTGDIKAMAEVLDRAVAEVAVEDPRLAEELEAQLLLFGPWDLELAPSLLPRVERLGTPEPGQGGQPIRLTVAALHALHTIRPASEVAAGAARALAAGALLARDTWMAAAGFVAVNVLALAGRPQEAVDHMERAMARDRARMAIGALRSGLGVRGRVAMMRGDVRAAETDVRALLDLAEEGELGPPGLLDLLIEVLIERGRLEEADEELQRSGFVGELPRFTPLNSLMSARARLRLAQGQTEAGIAELLACGERCEANGPSNPAIVPWRSQVAPALAESGRGEEALALAREELELARRFGATHVEGRSMRALGLVEEGPRRTGLLADAVATLEPSFARLELARALGDLGAALAADGRPAEARAHLGRALELAAALGASALADRLLERLIDAGGRPRSLSRRGVDGLTPAERRVAELAAAGLTNRQAAQELFLSEKTIETHLASTYRKLAIRSRAQLAGALGGGSGEPPYSSSIA